MAQHFILGISGQIGDAIRRVLSPFVVDGYDVAYNRPFKKPSPGYDFLHICIPYDKYFDDTVKGWQTGGYMADDCITVIHSTVPVGTSEAHNAVHSPVRGVHPDLEKGIRTFTKLFGGPGAEVAAAPFSQVGIPTRHFISSRETEAMKLWSTNYYLIAIAFEKVVHAYCEANNLDFDTVYRLGNETYNKGYDMLGKPEVMRPVLKHVPGRVGGHCLLPNLDLTLEGIRSDFLEAAREISRGVLDA